MSCRTYTRKGVRNFPGPEISWSTSSCKSCMTWLHVVHDFSISPLYRTSLGHPAIIFWAQNANEILTSCVHLLSMGNVFRECAWNSSKTFPVNFTSVFVSKINIIFHSKSALSARTWILGNQQSDQKHD